MCFSARWASSKPGLLMHRQVDLRFVARNHRLGIDAQPRQEHEHLLRRRVLRLVENDEGMIQRAAAHVGQRRNLDDASFGVLLDFLGWEHVVQRIVQRAQVRHDLLVQVARQEAERFAGLDRGAGQDNARDLSLSQSRQRHGDGQVGLARPGRANANSHVVAPNGIQVILLPHRFGGHARLLVGSLDAVAQDVLERGDALMLDDVEGMGELAVPHGGAGLERILQHQKQVFGALHGIGLAFELDPALAGGGFDAELIFQRLEIAGVVVVELLREAGVFEVEGFSGHGWR